jgi:hypothetical protein
VPLFRSSFTSPCLRNINRMPAPEFNVSGRDGNPGAAGIDRGFSIAAEGHHGRDGGNGSPGQNGTPAGTIKQQLLTPEKTALIPQNVLLAQPIEADVQIETELLFSSGEAHRVDTILNVDAGEMIWLRANGGSGGRGGDGGGGEQGGVGIR